MALPKGYLTVLERLGRVFDAYHQHTGDPAVLVGSAATTLASRSRLFGRSSWKRQRGVVSDPEDGPASRSSERGRCKCRIKGVENASLA